MAEADAAAARLFPGDPRRGDGPSRGPGSPRRIGNVFACLVEIPTADGKGEIELRVTALDGTQYVGTISMGGTCRLARESVEIVTGHRRRGG